MSYDRTERIRRAAILIASLDETVAEQMLDSMPRGEATKILAEVERLGELDAEELEDVLEEFRTAGKRGRAGDAGVEFTYSAPQPMVMAAAAQAARATNASATQSNGEIDGDAVLMAELLGREHPQTIAAVLSRLEQELGAAVFAALPADLQIDVLDRLAHLEPADEGAVQDIEVQLKQRMEEHRQRRARAQAAAELARRMVQKTPAGQRESLMARLSFAPKPQTVASAEPGRTERIELLRQAPDRVASLRMPRQGGGELEHEDALPPRFEAWAEDGGEDFERQSARPLELEDRSRELESLDDRTLLEALRAADERTVYCALAASSEKFLNRVASKLPRKQARRLRETVRSIGPTQITELRQAQHQLLAIAEECRQATTSAR